MSAGKNLIIIGLLFVLFSISINAANKKGKIEGCTQLSRLFINADAYPRCSYSSEEGSLIIHFDLMTPDGEQRYNVLTGERILK